jgi:hypothetical protein
VVKIGGQAVAEVDHRSRQTLFAEHDPPADAGLRTELAEDERLDRIFIGAIT